MPSMQYMRDVVAHIYPSNRRWAKRVDKMSDAQVVAIYNKQQNQSTPKKKANDENPDLPF